MVSLLRRLPVAMGEFHCILQVAFQVRRDEWEGVQANQGTRGGESPPQTDVRHICPGSPNSQGDH